MKRKTDEIIDIEYGDVGGYGHEQTTRLPIRTDLSREELKTCNNKCFEEFGKYIWNPDPEVGAEEEDILFYNDKYLPLEFIQALESKGIHIIDECFDDYTVEDLAIEEQVECGFHVYEYIIFNCIRYAARKFIRKDAIFEGARVRSRTLFIDGGYGLFDDED